MRIAEAVALEKSIDKELIINSMETGIAKAARSKFGTENNIVVNINRENGDIEIYRKLVISENPENLNIEISLLSKQVQKTEQSMIKTEQSIKVEQKNLELLKSEYAKMIYACFKKKGNRHDLIFIISAEDFNHTSLAAGKNSQFQVITSNPSSVFNDGTSHTSKSFVI